MENTLIDGRYLLLAEIGSGGEARVFRARDQASGDFVAVRLALQPDTHTTPNPPPFSHDGWVRLLTLGTDPRDGTYQVFELLEGKTLSQLIQTGPINPDEWRSFVEKSLDAVEALHHAGWIHGDLNADNFFLTASGWKLLELPFLRFDPPAGRSPLFGSIHTLAPEQIDGAPPSAQSDLYSLGCLYYYAASGQWPHPGSSVQEVAISCLRFDPPPLRQGAPDVPEGGLKTRAWLRSDWVMKLLSRNAQDRPPTISAARQLLGIA